MHYCTNESYKESVKHPSIRAYQQTVGLGQQINKSQTKNVTALPVKQCNKQIKTRTTNAISHDLHIVDMILRFYIKKCVKKYPGWDLYRQNTKGNPPKLLFLIDSRCDFNYDFFWGIFSFYRHSTMIRLQSSYTHLFL